MTTDAHPDIEIYIKAASNAVIEDWLNSLFETLQLTRQQGKISHYKAAYQQQDVPVMVVKKASGIYTSVYFESAHTPWHQDVDCARQAYDYLRAHADIQGLEIRCIASGWHEGDDPDEWLAINADGEQLIHWNNQ